MTSEDTSITRADRTHWLDVAVRAGASAASFIAAQATTRHELVWEEKAATDFVSVVDIGAEERIRHALLAEIPDLRIVGEELGPGEDPHVGLVAIVDPLDGTTNFLHGYPAYAVSIGIAMNGVPMAGVIHDVARGGVYTATAGGGAFVDGIPLRVSTTSRPTRALIGTGFPFKSQRQAAQYLAQLSALLPQVAGMRRAGAAALDLCDVARGRFDAFWELDLAPWDVAAGILLVREAGGIVTDLAGAPAAPGQGPIVAGNALLHPWFLRTLQEAA